MSDLISRQAAIYAIEKRMDDITCEEFAEGMSEAITEISLLSSAQSEPKTGKWIDAVLPNDSGGLQVQVCDQCNTFFPLAYTGGGHNYCPNCGAKMEGDKDEIN